MGLYSGIASAATYTAASVTLSDPRISATSGYDWKVSSVSATNIKCLKVTFSANADGTGTIGNGFTANSATVTFGSSTIFDGATGGTWTTNNNANYLEYTNGSSSGNQTTLTNAHFVIAGVTNASIAETSYWTKIATYTNTNCSTGPIDSVTVGFVFTNGNLLSLTVDGALTFTVTGIANTTSCDGANTTATSTATTIPFGVVTSAAVGHVCQNLHAATNSGGGYTLYIRYDQPPTNALSQTISDHTGTNASPTAFPAAGVTEAYGYSTEDATLAPGGTADRFTNPRAYAKGTTSNQEIAYESGPTTSADYDIAHNVNITNTTEPGTYTNTIIYTAVPVY